MDHHSLNMGQWEKSCLRVNNPQGLRRRASVW